MAWCQFFRIFVIKLSVCAWTEYSKMCMLLLKDIEIFQCLRFVLFSYHKHSVFTERSAPII